MTFKLAKRKAARETPRLASLIPEDVNQPDLISHLHLTFGGSILEVGTGAIIVHRKRRLSSSQFLLFSWVVALRLSVVPPMVIFIHCSGKEHSMGILKMIGERITKFRSIQYSIRRHFYFGSTYTLPRSSLNLDKNKIASPLSLSCNQNSVFLDLQIHRCFKRY